MPRNAQIAVDGDSDSDVSDFEVYLMTVEEPASQPTQDEDSKRFDEKSVREP